MEVIKMEWLKELLEKAKITDEKLNVDEVMEAAITTLKKENGDNEELQNKIKV